MLWFSKNHTAVWGTGGAKNELSHQFPLSMQVAPQRGPVWDTWSIVSRQWSIFKRPRGSCYISFRAQLYKLNVTLALSCAGTVLPAHRTGLRGANESPACFWMSCLPNAFSPQPFTSAALRWACMPAVRLSMSSVRFSRHRESSSCLSSACSPSENDVRSFGWLNKLYSWNSIDHARSDFKLIKTSADDRTLPSSDGAADGTFSKSFGNYCTYLSGKEPIESKSKIEAHSNLARSHLKWTNNFLLPLEPVSSSLRVPIGG